MESYCLHCGSLHEPGLSPLLCEQRRRGAMAVYGRILTREEIIGSGSDSLALPTKPPTEEITPEKPVEKTGGGREFGRGERAKMEARLAATEKRLAEIREKERVKKARWRGTAKARKPV